MHCFCTATDVRAACSLAPPTIATPPPITLPAVAPPDLDGLEVLDANEPKLAEEVEIGSGLGITLDSVDPEKADKFELDTRSIANFDDDPFLLSR